jgi:hypothetical protein
MAKWSEAIVKSEISRWIFDPREGLSEAERVRITGLRDVCTGPITSKERIAAIRAAARDLRAQGRLSRAEREIFEAVMAELKEIAEDIRFRSSKRGRFVLEMNDRIQQVYGVIRQDSRFADVMIGIHPSREELIAHGRVDRPEDLDELRSIIAAANLPLLLQYQVRVGSAA